MKAKELRQMRERLARAVEVGELQPSRARTLMGFLVLGAAGVPQGATRTVQELRTDCTRLGLTPPGMKP